MSVKLVPDHSYTEFVNDICCFCHKTIEYSTNNILYFLFSLESNIDCDCIESPIFINCIFCSSISHIECVWSWYQQRSNSQVEFSWPCVYSRHEDYSKSKNSLRKYKRYSGSSALAFCRLFETFKCDTCLSHSLLKYFHYPSDEKYKFCTRCFNFDSKNSNGHWIQRIDSIEKRWVCDSCMTCSNCGCNNRSESWIILLLSSLFTNNSISKPTKIDLLLCQKCYQQIEKREYCPICCQIYENDYSIPMLNCDICDRWIHLSCDPIYSFSEYSHLENTNEEYHCPICRHGTKTSTKTISIAANPSPIVTIESIWDCIKYLNIENEDIVDKMRMEYKTRNYPRDGRCALLHMGILGYDCPVVGEDWEYIPNGWLVGHWSKNHVHDPKLPRTLYCCYAKKTDRKKEFIVFDPLKQVILIRCKSQLEWKNAQGSDTTLSFMFGLDCFLLREYIEKNCMAIFHSASFPYISPRSPSFIQHLQNREYLRQSVISSRNVIQGECSRTNPIPYPRRCSRVYNIRTLNEHIMEYYRTFNIAQMVRSNRRNVFRNDHIMDMEHKEISRNNQHVVPFTNSDRFYLRIQYQIYRKRNGLEPNNGIHSDGNSSDSIVGNSGKFESRYQRQFPLTFWDLALLCSPIQGIGVFSLVNIPPNTIIIEYIGEVIGSGLGDGREKDYDKHGIGCYLFRLDNETIIDATKKGNIARYINHSCDPNCYSITVPVERKKIVLILSNRIIYPLEELTYDYKFSMEDGMRITCNCGALNCRGYMN